MDGWQPPCEPSRPLTATERNQRRRWREKQEMTHIHGLDVKTGAVAALVELGYLDEHRSEDRQAQRAAMERYVGAMALRLQERGGPCVD